MIDLYNDNECDRCNDSASDSGALRTIVSQSATESQTSNVADLRNDHCIIAVTVSVIAIEREHECERHTPQQTIVVIGIGAVSPIIVIARTSTIL